MLYTYDDFIDRINIQEVLKDAGYTHNKRDGRRYPSYVRYDSNGLRVRNDKFLVSPNGKTCFQPPVLKNYNIISFIKEHPNYFSDYKPGMDLDRLVFLVCNRILNMPEEERASDIIYPQTKSDFNINDYDIHAFNPNDRDTQLAFYPYFKARGINLSTQYAFSKAFMIASKKSDSGEWYKNLSFPMYIPGQSDIVGLEVRGWTMKDGTSYKGMAAGSNASNGLWIYSPMETPLLDVSRVYVFESAYDAMAFYQLHVGKDSKLSPKEKKQIKNSLFASTGGTPTYGQMANLITATPNATYHLAFDADLAGLQFVQNFKSVAVRLEPSEGRTIETVREEPGNGYKDFNDQLMGKPMIQQREEQASAEVQDPSESQGTELSDEENHISYHR